MSTSPSASTSWFWQARALRPRPADVSCPGTPPASGRRTTPRGARGQGTVTAGRRGRRCYQLGCHPTRRRPALPRRNCRSARPFRARSPGGAPHPSCPAPSYPAGSPQSGFPSHSTSLPSPTQPSPASRRAPSFAASARLPRLGQPRALADPHLPCPGPHRRGRCITAARRPGTALQSRQRAPPC